MVCRAHEKHGLSRLRLVAGCDHLHPEAFKIAVSAKDLLEQAELFDSLSDAWQYQRFSGNHTRSGKYRQELLSPPRQPRHSYRRRGLQRWSSDEKTTGSPQRTSPLHAAGNHSVKFRGTFA